MDKKQLQQRVTEQRRRVRRRLTIRGVLSLLVVLTFIRCAFMQRYENMFVCVLSLVLLAMPTLIEKQLAIDIPPMMEAIIYCFIYAAEIMGEINSFYTIIPGWDTMLHTSASAWLTCLTEANGLPSSCRRCSWLSWRSASP